MALNFILCRREFTRDRLDDLHQEFYRKYFTRPRMLPDILAVGLGIAVQLEALLAELAHVRAVCNEKEKVIGSPNKLLINFSLQFIKFIKKTFCNKME